MKNSGIYKITCVNGNCRIGESVDIEKRFSYYRAALRGGYFNNQTMQNDWNKYGEDNFSFGVLEFCPTYQLKEREEYYRDKYEDQNVYNKNKARTYNKHERTAEEAEEYKLKRSGVTKGSKNGNSTIDEKTAGAILFMLNHSDLTKAQIADMFGVTVFIVRNIYYGKRWVDIDPIMPIIKSN